MIKGLSKLATKLDSVGMRSEADIVDKFIAKIAQVATTGVPGAQYSGGRQTTPGFTGGQSKRFYRSKPRTLSEFNKFLGELVKDIGSKPGQSVFSAEVTRNPPNESMNSWTAETQKAFKEYCEEAGFPDAGRDWKNFAKQNRYEPTLFGIYNFWLDTVNKVADSNVTSIGEKEEGFIDFNRMRDSESEKSKGGYLNTPKMKPDGMGERSARTIDDDFAANLPSIKRNLLMYFEPGLPKPLGAQAYSLQVFEMINRVTDTESKYWFSKNANEIIPASISAPITEDQMFDLFIPGLTSEFKTNMVPTQAANIYRTMVKLNRERPKGKDLFDDPFKVRG
jgi:hypothetical protein